MSQSVRRAAAILDRIAERPSTASELAAEFGVHRTTMFRELTSLEDVGYARRTTTGEWVPGGRLIGLAQSALDHLDLRDVGRAQVTRLHRVTGNTVHLAALIDASIVYVDKREDASGVRLYSRVGKAVLPYCTGVGKAILAHLDETSRDAVLAGTQWRRFTDTTITTRTALDAELARVAERGWAVDDGEFEPFVACVAVPVVVSSGVVGALSVTALRAVEDLDSLTRHLPLMQQTAAHIAAAVG